MCAIGLLRGCTDVQCPDRRACTTAYTCHRRWPVICTLTMAPITQEKCTCRAAHFVLEQLAQRLDELELQVFGRPPTLCQWWLLIMWLCFAPEPGGGHDSMTVG
jgi:hypothetical protein